MVVDHYNPDDAEYEEGFWLSPSYSKWQDQVLSDLDEDTHSYLDSYRLSPKSTPRTGGRAFRKAVEIFWGDDSCPYRDDPNWRCGGNRCRYCFEKNIFALGSAIVYSKPRYFFTIGTVPMRRPERDRYMQDLQQHLRTNLTKLVGKPIRISWVWAVEDYSKFEGVHIHGYMHQVPGLFTPSRDDRAIIQAEMNRFSALPTRKGLPARAGEARVQYVELDPDANATYLMKARKLSQRALYPEEAVLAMARYRQLNGKKIVHASQGSNSFFRDADGTPINQAEAEALARARYRDRAAKGSYSEGPAILIEDENPGENEEL